MTGKSFQKVKDIKGCVDMALLNCRAVFRKVV